jgi:hypothetical protein
MAKTNWSECERDDLNQIPVALEKGWLPDFNYKDKMQGRITPENCPHETVSFFKNEKHTWKGYNRNTGESYWIVADLIHMRFTNHRQYDTLELVFENE